MSAPLRDAAMSARPILLPAGYRTVARTATADCPVALHQRRRRDYVITSCGEVLMATDDTRSERRLGHVAARFLRRVPRPRVLVGGLGMGFTLRALLDGLGRDAQVVVAELLGPVVRWNRERLGHLAGNPLDDPRVRVHVGDVSDLLRGRRAWDAIVLDIDNGPDWIVQRGNQTLYQRHGLSRLLAALRPGGFVALWSVGPHRAFERRLVTLGLRARRLVPAAPDDPAAGAVIYLVAAPRGGEGADGRRPVRDGGGVGRQDAVRRTCDCHEPCAKCNAATRSVWGGRARPRGSGDGRQP